MPKINTGCPAHNTAYLKDFNTNIFPCPKCGYEVEFFADERKVKCPKCHGSVFKVDSQLIMYEDGKLVYGDTQKNCLDWCGACLDKKDYEDILENDERISRKKDDFKELISTIEDKDKDTIDFLIEALKKSINSPKLIDDKVLQHLQKKNPGLFLKVRNYYLNYLNR